MRVSISVKNFHFQKLNWIISFPQTGNQGKYANYTVNVKMGSEPVRKQELGDILENQEFEQNYPHIVRYYKLSPEEPLESPSEVLVIKEIRCMDDFFAFLSSLDI